MKGCTFCRARVRQVDYKDAATLRSLLKPNGKIPARRSTRLCRRHQAQFARAVKRARTMALLRGAAPAK